MPVHLAMFPRFIMYLIIMTSSVSSRNFSEQPDELDFEIMRQKPFDHEMFLGGYKAAKEFQTLSPTESKDRLRVILKKADVNEDGFLDQGELQEWVVGSLKNNDRVIAEEHMMNQDKNGDGRLSLEECAGGDEGEDNLGNDIRMEVKDNKKMFDLADKNKNGFLEGDELLAFYNPNAMQDMQEIVIQRLLNDFDENTDGTVDMEEFIGLFEEHDLPDFTGNRKEPEWVMEERKIFQEQLDTDGNGKMEGEELSNWVRPRYDVTAEREAVHLIDVADGDGDGKLSVDEILDKYEVFTGSKASHFGRHIRSKKFPHEEL